MRTIFHCDINNCFASIEMAIHPELRRFPIAVAGDPHERRGIVLAKSESAKKCGVKTGDPLWRAKQKCPQIRFVLPHFEVYEQYSLAIRQYYEQFTERVEPYGLDECWLDVTTRQLGECACYLPLAEKIRLDIKRIFGVTVSIGVSFNKIFAKLGSDLRKPDAVTLIDPEHFREQIWPLPVSSLLYVGRSTVQKLWRAGIFTIGHLAAVTPVFIRNLLGKNGLKLWVYANGMDDSPVLAPYEQPLRQSLGHGTTLPVDVCSIADLWPTILMLSENIAMGLQNENLIGFGIQIYIRRTDLTFQQFQMALDFGLSSSRMIADYSLMLLSQNYDWEQAIRAIGIRLFDLHTPEEPHQLSLFGIPEQSRKNHVYAQIDGTVQKIRMRFGEEAIAVGYLPKLKHWCHPPGGSNL